MPNVELSEEELLAQLAALRASKAPEEQPSAAEIPGLTPAAVPLSAKQPTDRKKAAPKPPAKPRRTAAPAAPITGNLASSDDDYDMGFTAPGGEETDLRLPSGRLCRVKVIGPENLLSSGLLDQIDSLTAIACGDLIPKAERGRSQIDAKALMND